MHSFRPSLLRLAPLGLAAVLAAGLTACGGGGEDAAMAVEAPQPLAAGPDEAQATGRAQALAYTLPALQPAPAGTRGNIVCANWRVGAITVDNVEVPPGTACRLNGTRVLGSVQVHTGAILIGAGVNVSGSVQGDAASHVQLTGTTSRVGGNVELEGGGSGTLTGVRVAGDVFFNGLTDLLLVRNAVVGGNVQLTDNLGGGEVTGNRVTGNLQCTGNTPAPLASGNTAASIEAQCLAGGGTTPPPPPLSGNVTCVGLTIGAIRLDSVSVPAGASCTLLGTLLNGNIEVGANARLIADSVTVTGGVVSDGAAELSMGGTSRVGGSVQVQRGAGANLAGVSVTGDLQFDAMTGPVNASNNRVTGNLQAMANRGGVALQDNRMGGVMQCKDNLPAPTGRGNVATLKQDQCLGL
jgi:hypothetical protein